MDVDTLLLPFRFGFMQNAFLISVIVSVPTALLSCFLVMKGWALMGDAVSHAVLPGIVLAYIFGLPLIVGAFAAGMTCAIATGYLSSNSRVKEDTVMGVVFSGMFGIGIVLYVSVETNAHLDHILFGNMLGVDQAELWTAGVISVGVGLMLVLKWKDWLLHSFDPAQARASGLWVIGGTIADHCCYAFGGWAYPCNWVVDCTWGDCVFDGAHLFNNALGVGRGVHGIHAVGYIS